MTAELEEILRQAYKEAVAGQTTSEGFHDRMTKTRDLLVYNPPPEGKGAYLLVVGQKQRPYWIKLTPGFVIGRGAQADLRLRHAWVSDPHCMIDQIHEDWVLRDCGSTNGTVVNAHRVTCRALCRGDAIEIADHILLFIRNTTQEQEQ